MEKKNSYIFPAIFEYSKENEGIGIYFPDLPGAITYGATDEEAFKMAKECLELHLYGMEEENLTIPKAVPIFKINCKKNEAIVLVKANMLTVRNYFDNKPLKKTLTIPKWLNDIAVKKKINFSSVLKEALIEKLELN